MTSECLSLQIATSDSAKPNDERWGESGDRTCQFLYKLHTKKFNLLLMAPRHFIWGIMLENDFFTV